MYLRLKYNSELEKKSHEGLNLEYLKHMLNDLFHLIQATHTLTINIY